MEGDDDDRSGKIIKSGLPDSPVSFTDSPEPKDNNGSSTAPSPDFQPVNSPKMESPMDMRATSEAFSGSSSNDSNNSANYTNTEK